MPRLTKPQIKEVKAIGCLFNRESEDCFNVRVIGGNGTYTANEFTAIALIAKKYGNGILALTSRQTIEISGVKYENIPSLQREIVAANLLIGGTGNRIRPVTACKGTTCVFGQIDTQEIAQKIHLRFFVGYKNKDLPHKFKISVGGCPNNCLKPDLNDIGLIGSTKPCINTDLCRGCKKCAIETNCLRKAVSVIDARACIGYSKCNSCGKCVKECPFKAVNISENGIRIVIGGKWGRETRQASSLTGLYSEIEALNIIEKTIRIYCENGHKKERFGDMITRIGHDKVEKLILEP